MLGEIQEEIYTAAVQEDAGWLLYIFAGEDVLYNEITNGVDTIGAIIDHTTALFNSFIGEVGHTRVLLYKLWYVCGHDVDMKGEHFLSCFHGYAM